MRHVHAYELVHTYIHGVCDIHDKHAQVTVIGTERFSISGGCTDKGCKTPEYIQALLLASIVHGTHANYEY